MFGSQALPAKNTTTVSAVQKTPAPYPAQTETLFDLGAEWLWAVWALNITKGSLVDAEKLLNLTALL